MGLTVKHEFYPWERAQQNVKSGIADALITVPLPFRKEYSEVSKENVFGLTMTGFASIKNPKLNNLRTIKTISDLKPFTVGTYIGSGWVKNNIKDQPVDYAATIDLCLEKLLKGRYDVYVDTAEINSYKIKKKGLHKQIVKLPAEFQKVPFFLHGWQKVASC